MRLLVFIIVKYCKGSAVVFVTKPLEVLDNSSITKKDMVRTCKILLDHLSLTTYHSPITTYHSLLYIWYLQLFINYILAFEFLPSPRETLDDIDISKGMQAMVQTDGQTDIAIYKQNRLSQKCAQKTSQKRFFFVSFLSWVSTLQFCSGFELYFKYIKFYFVSRKPLQTYGSVSSGRELALSYVTF